MQTSTSSSPLSATMPFSGPYGMAMGSHCVAVPLCDGIVELTIIDGIVTDHFHNLNGAVINIEIINDLLRREWPRKTIYDWVRLISASISYPDAGEGREEEFMMAH
jgi:hypothetical protein